MCGLQRKTKVSCMRMSADHSSFYVGYAFSGVVEKYTVDAGMLICSAAVHYGDVHTVAVVQPGVLCTSGSDGQVRLVNMSSTVSTVKASTWRPTPVTLSCDEVAYRQMRNGVQSLRRVNLLSDTSTYLLVCVSSLAAPLLVNIRDVFRAQPLSLHSLTDIGTPPLFLLQ